MFFPSNSLVNESNISLGFVATATVLPEFILLKFLGPSSLFLYGLIVEFLNSLSVFSFASLKVDVSSLCVLCSSLVWVVNMWSKRSKFVVLRRIRCEEKRLWLRPILSTAQILEFPCKRASFTAGSGAAKFQPFRRCGSETFLSSDLLNRLTPDVC